RMQNLRGNIKLRRKKTAPEKVMLIDDIFTTGATGDACAELLKSAGAQEVKLLTIAID
ncbi:MAG: ComF family protein, partial [Spirochaetales bacterium]|nr:ComF family protein [Spirochaetales bacterium]